MQYSTEQLIKEVENSIAEFKQYNQDYDEDNIRQQVFNSLILVFLVVSSFARRLNCSLAIFLTDLTAILIFLILYLVYFHLTNVNYQWIISSMLKGIICLTLSFPMNGKPHLYYFYVEFNDAGPGCSRGSEGAWMAQGELHSRVYQAMSLWCCWVKALWTWERWLVWWWAILWVTLVLANQPTQWRILAHSSPVQWLRICFYIA